MGKREKSSLLAGHKTDVAVWPIDLHTTTSTLSIVKRAIIADSFYDQELTDR
jgi:hypothetical protein